VNAKNRQRACIFSALVVTSVDIHRNTQPSTSRRRLLRSQHSATWRAFSPKQAYLYNRLELGRDISVKSRVVDINIAIHDQCSTFEP